MTDPKHTYHDEWGRQYLHPVTGEPRIGVSTLIKWVQAAPYLKDWGERQVADAAVDWITNDALAVSMSPIDPEALRRYFREAPNLFTEGRSHTGDIVHEWASAFKQDSDAALPDDEYLKKWPLADLPRARVMCEHYRDMVERWQITFHHWERTVINNTLGYMGTFDDMFSSPLLFDGEWHIGDTKTTGGGKPRVSVTYQLPMYAMADEMVLDDDTVVPKPEVSLKRGYVLKVRETGGQLHKVEFTSEKYGLHMLAEISAAVRHYQWVKYGDRLISVALSNPTDLKPRDVERQLKTAKTYDELVAIYRRATIEDAWVPDKHQEIAAARRKELEAA